MATKDWNGFKKSGDTYIPNDATARAGLQNKVDKVSGKGLSTNDYDNTAKAVVTTAQDNIKANTKLIKDTVGWSGKNKLEPVPYRKVTISGIEWTFNTNGTVTANGTATALSLIAYCERYGNTGNKRIFPNGRYIISGGINENCYIQCGRTHNNAYEQIGQVDTGSGSLLVLDGDDGSANEVTLQILCGVKNGVTVNNVVFELMVRDADILDPTYEPNFGSTAFPRSEQAVLGAKNGFNYEAWKSVQIFNGTGVFENNGITLTATAADAYTSHSPAGGYPANATMKVKTGDKISIVWDINSDDPAGLVYLFKYQGTTSKGNINVSATTKRIDYTVEANVDNITIRFGVTDNGNTIHYKNIMCVVQSETDLTYAPYAMTNRELTVNLPIATAATLDDVISIMAQKTICLINSSNNHLIDALTNNDLQDTTCKIIAYNQGSMIDWYGMVGASAFCIGRITNGAYTSHKKATLS